MITDGEHSVYLTPRRVLSMLQRDGTAARINSIGKLPFVRPPVIVYPDASSKSYGFPAGLRIETDPGWLYPLAAPDLGCGYAVVDTGMELGPDDGNHGFDILLAALSNDVDVRYTAEDAAAVLMQAKSLPGTFDWLDATRENVHDWLPAIDEIPQTGLDKVARSLGRAAGHFVALYAVAEASDGLGLPRGRIIAVVHTGASPFRSVLNDMDFYVTLGSAAIASGVVSASEAAKGDFPVSVESELGQRFLGYAAAARNFGYYNRLLVAENVMRVVRNLGTLQSGSTARLLRHVDHVAFERSVGGIVARRGLQRLVPGRPVFITGGAHTRAYLCHTPDQPNREARGLVPHGAAVTSGMYASEEELTEVDQLWAEATETNTELSITNLRDDVASLGDVIDYCIGNRWLESEVLLRPLLNYRDTNHG